MKQLDSQRLKDLILRTTAETEYIESTLLNKKVPYEVAMKPVKK